eukprot:jgi/Mesvir1/4796/Mv11092-RA.1
MSVHGSTRMCVARELRARLPKTCHGKLRAERGKILRTVAVSSKPEAKETKALVKPSASQALPEDPRIGLVQALTAVSVQGVQRAIGGLWDEALKYLTPRIDFSAESLAEAFMIVPDLETVPYTVLSRNNSYEVRRVEAFNVAEVEMDSAPWNFRSSGKSFNELAGFLFGDNTVKEEMAMTTPVIQTPRSEPMEMTTPVIQQRTAGGGGPSRAGPWTMSFVLPAKYTGDSIPKPNNPRVTVKRVPERTLAVKAFPGFCTEADVARQERRLRSAIARSSDLRLVDGAQVIVSQIRRNEVALEVELLE